MADDELDLATRQAGVQTWLGDGSFADVKAEFDTEGYVVFERVLGEDMTRRTRLALSPYLKQDLRGRNDFEGVRSNRVYALLAKDSIFAELAIHPLALAFVEADLGRDCLLSACLAINLQPGESAQPWHYDDSHYAWPRPRPSLGVSAFWAVDDLTETNGATELLPRSHTWGETAIGGVSTHEGLASRTDPSPELDPGYRADAVKALMPAGSLMLAKGTLWHRGGANRSSADRLLITPQYCPGWTRPLENMSLAVPPRRAASLPERAQELLGYSICAPFMGYVDGMHPKRTLS